MWSDLTGSKKMEILLAEPFILKSYHLVVNLKQLKDNIFFPFLLTEITCSSIMQSMFNVRGLSFSSKTSKGVLKGVVAMPIPHDVFVD